MCASAVVAPSYRGFAIDHIREIRAALAAGGAMEHPSRMRLLHTKLFPDGP
jgi:hypothetical protein